MLEEEGYDPWSGNAFVNISDEFVVLKTSKINRKVLTTAQDNCPANFILVDHKRPFLPISSANIQIPVFPQLNDMVFISSADGQEPYLGLVKKVSNKDKKVKIQYYILSNDQLNWKPYTDARGSLDTVSWDAILKVACGTWNGNSFRVGI